MKSLVHNFSSCGSACFVRFRRYLKYALAYVGYTFKQPTPLDTPLLFVVDFFGRLGLLLYVPKNNILYEVISHAFFPEKHRVA